MKEMLDRLHWPQVAALAIAVAGLVLALVFVPPATWAAIPWQAIIAAVVSIGAGGASALLGPLLAPRTPQPAQSVASARPERIPSRSSEDGSSSVDVLLALVSLATLAWAALRAWAPAILVSLGLAGCGVSALQVHATIASLAGTTVDTGCSIVQHERDVEQHAALDANETREAARAAVDAVRLRWEPYVFGCNLAADAQNAWAEFLTLSAASGGFTLASSLALAVPLAHAWDDFVALRPPMPDGVTLPLLPADLLSLIATMAPTGGAQ